MRMINTTIPDVQMGQPAWWWWVLGWTYFESGHNRLWLRGRTLLQVPEVHETLVHRSATRLHMVFDFR